MIWFGRMGVCCLLGLVLPMSASRAASPVRSASQRFIVSGMSKEDNVGLATAVDDAAARFEQVVGRKIPFEFGPVVRVMARVDEHATRGRVVKAQGWVDGGLEQKLVVYNVSQVQQEDLLEGLCWLLFNRLAIKEQSPASRESAPAESPEWLTAGVAQNLFTALRVRNTRLALGEWNHDCSPLPDKILSGVYLPAGRWKDKCYAGLMVEWMESSCDDFWIESARRIARKAPLSPEWLAGLLKCSSVRDMRKSWDIWLAGRSQVLREWGEISSGLMDELEGLLTVRPSQLGVLTEADVPPEMSWDELSSFREREWMLPLSTRLHLQLKSLGIGQPREFQEVLDAYGEYLTCLPTSGAGGRKGRGVPAADLKHKLAQAQAARLALEQSTLDRERFEVLVEQDEKKKADFKVDPMPQDEDKFKNYLDDMERQRRKE